MNFKIQVNDMSWERTLNVNLFDFVFFQRLDKTHLEIIVEILKPKVIKSRPLNQIYLMFSSNPRRAVSKSAINLSIKYTQSNWLNAILSLKIQ